MIDSPSGVELTSEQAEALAQLFDDCDYMWVDNGTHFSCTEATTLHRFLKAFGHEGTADAMLREHTTDDDEGDPHFIAADGSVGWRKVDA